MEKYFADIIVIGAGASGMLCACTAAEKNKNKKVVLLEKEAKCGRKLLATGNGRCNLTNLTASPEDYTGSFDNGVRRLFELYPPSTVISRFEQLGLACRADDDSRIYPLSRQSSTVNDLLLYFLKRSAVLMLTGFCVTDIKKEKRKFLISSADNRVVIGEKLVVCSGGKASPKLGSDGSLFAPLARLGHTVTPLYPALCPIPSADKALRRLKGVRSRVKVRLLDEGRLVKEAAGEIQFTDKALSGICIFDLSAFVYGLKKPEISVSFMPEKSEEDIFRLLSHNREVFAAEPPEKIFLGTFNANVAGLVISKSAVSAKNCAALSDKQLKIIARTVNSVRFSVSAPISFDNAQITCGGVSGEEINPFSLESLKVPRLYFCGEVLDASGPCGGFNLQLAFASALLVGDNI